MHRTLDIYKGLVFLAIILNALLDIVWWTGAFLGDFKEIVYELSGSGASIPASLSWGLYIAFIAALYIGLIGMFFCHWLARPVIVLSIALSAISSALSGLVVFTQLENVILLLANITLYLAVGMAFFSPHVMVKYRQSFRGFVSAGF